MVHKFINQIRYQKKKLQIIIFIKKKLKIKIKMEALLIYKKNLFKYKMILNNIINKVEFVIILH